MSAQEELDRIHERIYLLNNLLRKMEFNRLKILYHFNYYGDYDKKRKDLHEIDVSIQRAIDMRVKLCDKLMKIMDSKNNGQGVLIDG